MIAVHQDIIITGSSQRPIALDIRFNNNGRPKPVILFAHGFNGFKDWGAFHLVAEAFAAYEFTFIKFNFSHNGTTPESPTDFVDLQAFGNNNYSKQLADLTAVTNWVCDAANPFAQQINSSSVFLVGHSMGGGIGILYAHRDQRIKALVTLAAISECKTPWGSWSSEKLSSWKEQGVAYNMNGRTKQQMPLYYQLFKDYEQNCPRLDIMASMAQLTIPVLICHGAQDEAVSVEKAKQLHEAQPTSEILLLDTNHVFGQQHPWTAAALPDPLQLVIDKAIYFFKAVAKG